MNYISKNEQQSAKVAGALLWYTFLIGLLPHLFIWSPLYAPGDIVATANNIMANESLFRIGIVLELFIAVGAIVLGQALYLLLHRVNPTLALVGLLAKGLEGALITGIALISFVSLWIANTRDYLFAFTPEQIDTIVGLSLDAHFALYTLPVFFAGAGGALFFYLFAQSKLLPRPLAMLGMSAYGNLFVYAIAVIAAPSFAAGTFFQVVSFAPSIVAELVIGYWLLFRPLGVGELMSRNAAPELA